MTKTELLQIRDSTYRPPPVSEKRCETYKHYWGMYTSQRDAIEIRGRLIRKEVHPLGVCDLWEEKR